MTPSGETVLSQGTPACFVCGARAGALLVETHLDHICGTEYRLWSCAVCAAVYSDPHEPVGADWYQRSMSGEMPVSAGADQRYAMFFEDGLAEGPLLDVGCGQGDFLLLARARGYRVSVGIDYDPRRVELARQAGLDAYAQDWESFCRSRPAGEFSTITLFDFLEHVPDPAKLLSEIHRLLRPGGHLAITLLNDLRPMPFGREFPDYPPHHFTRWSPAALKGLLERAGYSVARQESGRLEFRYLLELATTHCAVEPALGLAKRIIFGRSCDPSASVTDNFVRTQTSRGLGGFLAAKKLRSLLFTAYRQSAKIAFSPAVLGLTWYYRLTRTNCGNNLYTLARKDGA